MKAEAEAAAKSQLGAFMSSLGEADLSLAKGDPWIRDEQKMLLRGFRDGINGGYVTSIVSQTYARE